MSKLVDPTICPDCRAPLDVEAVCTGCGLVLRGAPAVRLWDTMKSADRLVEELRRASVRVPVAAGPVAPPAAPTPAREVPLPTFPVAPPRERTPRRLPTMSVPVVLLSLGALCLLVAAVVFVVVTWGSLGLTGRTLVLLGVTGLVAGSATLATRRALRGAAETLWLVVAGMLGLDLLAAHSAGLAGMDSLSGRHSLLLTGLVLAALGAAVALWTDRRPVSALWGMQAVAVGGTVLATAAGAWLADDAALGTAVAVPLLLAAAHLLRRLPVVAAAVAGVAAVTWLALVALGVARLDAPAGWTSWWAQLHGWPLLVAAGYAGAGTLVRRVPALGRQLLAGAALVLLVLLAVAPVAATDSDRQSLARSAALVGLALVVLLGRRTWGVPSAVLAAVGALGLGLATLVSPWVALDLVTSPWTHLAAGLAVATALLAAPRTLPAPWREQVAEPAALAGAAVVAAGAAAAVAGLRLAVPGEAACLTALALAVGALTWFRRRTQAHLPSSVVGALGTAYLLLLAYDAAAPSSGVTAAVGGVVVLALALWYADAERRGPAVAPAVLASAAVLLGGHALLAAGDALRLTTSVAAYVATGAAAIVALAAHRLSRRPASRLALEVSALVVALGASLVAPPIGTMLVLQATALVAALLAVRHADRTGAGWVALPLVALAAIVQVEGARLPHPALYAVPVTLLLLTGGVLRGRRLHLVASGIAHAGLVLALAVDELGVVESSILTAGAVLLLALHVHLESHTERWTAALAVAVGTTYVGAALVGWSRELGAPAELTAVLLAALAAVVLLLARQVTRQSTSRLALEATVALLAVVALRLSPDTETAAVVLVVVGTAVAVLAAWQRDRVLAGWPAVLVLAAAIVLGLSAGVRAPELQVLPAMAVLLLSGLLGRGRADGTGTLASGTVLGFVATSALLAGGLDDRLVAVTATLLVAGAAAAWVRAERLDAPVESPALALLSAYAGLVAVLAWTTALDAGDATLATSLATWAALLLVVAGPLSRQAASRLVLEVAGGLVTVVALAATPAGTTQPLVLTVVGTAVAIVAVTTRDREWAGWASTLLLGAATVLRVVDHVEAPELYTLPAAILLLGAGAWRLRTDAAVGSVRALGAGLTLALAPSLLLALDEPVSLRGALLAVGGVVVLAAGVRGRLAAPLVLGAGTLALLALRHLTPAAEAVPRWISLGLLGVALLVVGITWEARLRDLRAAKGYLGALR